MDQAAINYHRNLPFIRFQGRTLPRHAFLFSHAGSVATVPEETAVWFWRFTISAGGRSDRGETVRHHAQILLEALERLGVSAIGDSTVSKELYDIHAVYLEWVIALKQIIASSQGVGTCVWDADVVEASDCVNGQVQPPLGGSA